MTLDLVGNGSSPESRPFQPAGISDGLVEVRESDNFRTKAIIFIMTMMMIIVIIIIIIIIIITIIIIIIIIIIVVAAILQIVAVSGINHLGAIKAGLRRATPIAQVIHLFSH